MRADPATTGESTRTTDGLRRDPVGPCWICGSRNTSPWREGLAADEIRPDDLRITDARYGLTLPLAECGACGFRFAMGEALPALESLYAQLDDPGYEESSPARETQMAWLVRLARESHPQARTALDVGAAAGLLVSAAGSAGLEATGVEPSAALAAKARSEGHDVRTGVLPHSELAGHRFDVVFLVDVLEHVDAPIALLARCADAMQPDGRLVLVTPDGRSMAARLLGRRWWHYRIAHVSYFDRRTLARALERAGLRAERLQRARWFFPIGYLATRLEQYLPVAWLNRLVRRTPGLRRIYDWIVPLDLRDSFAVVARRTGRSGRRRTVGLRDAS